MANIMAVVDAYLEDGQELSVRSVARLPDDAWSRAEGPEPNFGFTDKTIWLRIPIQNAAPETIERLLWLQTNFMTELDVWLVGEAEVRTLLSQDLESDFSSRPFRLPNLVAPLPVEGGFQGTIFIRYRSQGNSHLPLSIETPKTFIESYERRSWRMLFFYGAGSVFVMVSAVAFLWRRERVFLYYGLYGLSVLVYVMQRDGYAFMLLWPEAPRLNNVISLQLGCALIGFAALFARALFESRRRFPIMDKVLLGCVVISVAVGASPIVIDQSTAKLYAFFWFLLAAFTYLGCGLFCWRKIGGQSVFFAAGWFGLVTASLVTTYVNFTEMPGSRLFVIDTVRTSLLFDATMMGLALVQGYLKVWRRSEEADRARIDLLGRLAVLERRFSDLKEKAEARGQRIADATHDIRQPLFALRSSIEHLLNGPAPTEDQLAAAKTSVLYIEHLIDDQFDASAINHVEHEKLPEAGQPVSLVLDAVRLMFRSEAEAKGLTFRVVTSSGQFNADPLRMTRIISNLTANAIRYTTAGGVIVGCKRRGGAFGVEVYDTGPGICPHDLERFAARGVRGAASTKEVDGRGLGLAIVRDIARQEKLSVYACSSLGAGTVFRVEPARSKGSAPPNFLRVV
ncbi:MAG: sensor histidine kinase [Parvularcula sp.]|nr:sensor histidine kinase [Parvularcula sp.]